MCKGLIEAEGKSIMYAFYFIPTQRFRSELFERTCSHEGSEMNCLKTCSHKGPEVSCLNNVLETGFRLICLNQLKGQAPGNIPVPPEVETRAVVDGVVVWKVRGK